MYPEAEMSWRTESTLELTQYNNSKDWPRRAFQACSQTVLVKIPFISFSILHEEHRKGLFCCSTVQREEG
jgi:hypothetical protein